MITWTRGDKYFWRGEPGGYVIAACRVVDRWRFPLHQGQRRIGIFDSAADARAAAEADYAKEVKP